MKISTNHNYYNPKPFSQDDITIDNKKETEKRIFEEPFLLTTRDLQYYKNLIFTSLYRKHVGKEITEDQVILKIFSNFSHDTKKKENYIQTGLYTGLINYTTKDNTQISVNIIPDCGEFFLFRMLNVINHIFLKDNFQKTGNEKSNTSFEFIIHYLFINSVEKARILGYPQQYDYINIDSRKFHGQLDTTNYIKNDLPYKGKLSIKYRERVVVQEIIDVLYAALLQISKTVNLKSKCKALLAEINPYVSKHHCDNTTIKKAINHPVLHNPMYIGFRKSLNYAELILHKMNFSNKAENAVDSISGYLIDSSELWEVYLQNLLQHNLSDWEVMGQEIMPMYKNTFFGRDFYPDIVLKKRDTNEYAVFDAKFKRMEGRNFDVDRNDLHQIHTYAGYYSTLGILKACGLIYPCKITPEQNWKSSLFNLASNTEFIIDGIDVTTIEISEKDENISIKEKWDILEKEENAFIERIKNVLN